MVPDRIYQFICCDVIAEGLFISLMLQVVI